MVSLPSFPQFVNFAVTASQISNKGKDKNRNKCEQMKTERDFTEQWFSKCPVYVVSRKQVLCPESHLAQIILKCLSAVFHFYAECGHKA